MQATFLSKTLSLPELCDIYRGRDSFTLTFIIYVYHDLREIEERN